MSVKRQAVKQWQFPSKSAEGKIHTVSEWPDGTLSCNCPAWTFKKAGQERECVHTRGVAVSKDLVPVSQWASIGSLALDRASDPSVVGKSTLLVNLLLSRKTAVPSAQPGTRRMRLGEDEEGGDDAL